MYIPSAFGPTAPSSLSIMTLNSSVQFGFKSDEFSVVQISQPPESVGIWKSVGTIQRIDAHSGQRFDWSVWILQGPNGLPRVRSVTGHYPMPWWKGHVGSGKSGRNKIAWSDRGALRWQESYRHPRYYHRSWHVLPNSKVHYYPTEIIYLQNKHFYDQWEKGSEVYWQVRIYNWYYRQVNAMIICSSSKD